MKFPKIIYVRRESKNNESYLLADEIPDGENGDKVGIYILKEIKTLKENLAVLI